MKKQKGRRKQIIIGIISLGIIILIYLITTLYFANRFYFGSAINSIDISGKTVEEAEEKISSELKNYKLVIEGKDGAKEEINGADIDLKYNKDNAEIQEIKNKQNPLNWFSSLFIKKEHEIKQIISYNEELLNKVIGNLSIIKDKNVIKSQNPILKYNNGAYEIIPEKEGNEINKEALKKAVNRAIIDGDFTLNLEDNDCYEKSKYNIKSKEVTDAKEILNKYVSSKITYYFGDKSEGIDGTIISNWIDVDEKYNVSINEEKAKAYINRITQPYNTIGKTRSFTASSGKKVNISGGDYGGSISSVAEVKEIVNSIKDGTTITRDYKNSQPVMSSGINDIGKTYVEINLTKQHIWFYKNGNLVIESDVVTGDLSKGHATPQGVYKLKSREKDRILRGEDYASPVSFWMPFNGGIGLHDATWRGAFGGSIYTNNGSHGCVNAPYNVAKTIYDGIEVGIPMVCYFE